MKKANSAPKLSTNLIYNILYRLSTIIVPLITTPYISRVLGSENTGIYSYTYTIAQYFVIFGCFGFENYGNRQIATVRDSRAQLNQTFSSLFGLQLITGCTAAAAYGIYLILFCRRYPVFSVISGLYVLASIFNISWFFCGMERFKLTAVRTIFVRFLGLILIFVFVKDTQDLGTYIFILALMEFLNQLLLWFRVKRFVNFVRVSLSDILQHVKGCAILFLPVILINIYRMMDKLMLGNMSTMAEIGNYTYADKIVEVPFHVITAIGVVMLPRMTNLAAHGKKEETLRYIEITMRYNTVLASALSFGLIAVRKDFIFFFLGSGYERCITLIAIIAPMIIIRAWANAVRTQYLMPNRKDMPYVISLIFGVVVNLILNAVSIPHFGAAGAAMATLLAESTVAVVQIAACKNDLPVGRYIKSNCPFILFGIVMFAVVELAEKKVNGNISALCIQIFAGALAYLSMVVPYLYRIDRENVQKVLGILKNISL